VPIFQVDAPLLRLFQSQSLVVNGTPVSSLGNDQSVLQSVFENGLNAVRSEGRKWNVWLEGKQLINFEQPYVKSYAVVAAIDKYYQRGYPKLENMVDNAKKLIDRLILFGFPRENIITLFDENATSETLDQSLREFWEGGSHADADRVLFYFGGHGDTLPVEQDDDDPARAKGMLITYNFKNDQPSRTSFLVDNIVRDHFDLIKPRHFIALIDACASGMAIPRTLDKEEDDQRLAKARKLEMIRKAVSHRARDILVAGKNGQRALYEHGGIFTNALLKALDGRGDVNRDHIIEFDELSFTIKSDVSFQASSQFGKVQTPQSFSIGTGEVVFMKAN
jgi:Caspase domain